MKLERVFESVDVEDGVGLVFREGRWYVISQTGLVFTFTEEDQEPTVFLDLTAAIEEAGEAGLLDIAFHPDFDANAEVFAFYNAPGGTRFLSIVSRFTSPDDGLTADPASERLVLEVDQPFSNHNGGDIGFGNDGMLYIGLGDGGSTADPQGNGQDRDTLLGSMLRIDVDDVEPFRVPEDNPFFGGPRPEVWAYGLRNPWRWTFDRETGALWAGDVGQFEWEEVNVIERGGNYGWNAKEGRECFSADACSISDAIDPVAQYRNAGSASIIGGYVYRGKELDDLDGAYIFNDYYDGAIWALEPGATDARIIGTGARRIAGWALGPGGELYGVSHSGGVFALRNGDDDREPFPRLLSQTGCVDMENPRRPANGTIEYELNVPFWSDGAQKVRFMALPDGTSASIQADGDLDFPDGTVLVKSFFRDGLPIESRLFVRHEEGGWAGYGYAWNDERTEATLVEDELQRQAAGGAWAFPGLRGCDACHTPEAGGSLGPEIAQLNRGGQLQALIDAGVLPTTTDDSRLPEVDGDEPLQERARAYLHANCSQCHREDGPGGRTRLDLRYGIPLSETGLCDEERAGDLGVQGGSIIAPGDPDASVLHARVIATGDARMPPLGSLVVDAEGSALLADWITSLSACP